MFLLLRDKNGLCVGGTGDGVPLEGMQGLDGGDDVLGDGDEVVEKVCVPGGVGGGFNATDVEDEELEEMLKGLLGTVQNGGKALQAIENGGGECVLNVGDAGLKAVGAIDGFTKGVWGVVSQGGG